MKFGHFIVGYFPEIKLDGFDTIEFSKRLNLTSPRCLNDLFSWPPNIYTSLCLMLQFSEKHSLANTSDSRLLWLEEDDNKVHLLAQAWSTVIGGFMLSTQDQQSAHVGELKDVIGRVFNQRNFDCSIFQLLEDETFIYPVFYLLRAINELFDESNNDDDWCDEPFATRLNSHQQSLGILH